MAELHPPSPSRGRPSGSGRPNLLAMAVLAACIVYVLNVLTDADDGIDYDHYIPGHRFLFDDPEQISDPDYSESDSDAPARRKVAPPVAATLRRRSPEEVADIHRRGLKASAKRAENAGAVDLDPDVAARVKATASKLDVPKLRRHDVTSYDVDAALLAERAFHRELLFFVYDSATDDFVAMHNLPTCDWGCKRAYIVAPFLARALRKNYPERFQGAESGDLVFLLSVGDMPRIRRPCLFEENKHCKSEHWAPVLQFGSVLADPAYMPTAIAMPQSPRPHVPCFAEFQDTGSVCQDLRPRSIDRRELAAPSNGDEDLKTGQHFHHGLVFGKEMGLLDEPDYWDDLIPQVIWRGTDFTFLHALFPDMRSPSYNEDIAPKEARFGDDVVRGAIRALWEMGEDQLTPRWRGVLLTSEAEREASRKEAAADSEDAPPLPWVDIKFASCNVDGEKVPASQNEELRLLRDKFGIAAIGQSVSMMEHARYKYHIDLGGGGGTTWTGTVEKLALPGALFHHVTPAKDWYHDRLEPWVHYVPVRQDLSDLREKYDWAESHPDEARRIAEAGTAFARAMGTPEGFGELYQEHVVAPLGNVIRAYKKPRKRHGGKRLLDILKEAGEGDKKEGGFGVVARCGGWPAERNECRWTRRDSPKEGGPKAAVAAAA
ncbi:hypothetical protein ACHAWF_003976 [Thalassiosira exigua]